MMIMKVHLDTPGREQVQDALSAALCDFLGAEARLENWVARPLSKRGKHRAMRYDLEARVAGELHVRRYQWVGKFYERDDDARRVAAVLGELGAGDRRAQGGLVIPGVLAYHAPLHLLLLTYESGESVVAALERDPALVLPVIGRALAALQELPVGLEGITSAAMALGGLQRRIDDLCARFPDAAGSLRRTVSDLERQMPAGPVAPSFLHGDLGPAQLLWQMGRIVVLDFDKCTRGDPALDLGNLLTQVRRLTLRKPGKLPDFSLLRWGILDAYESWSAPDPDLSERVAWYEQVMLLRKIQFLASDTTRHKEAEAIRQRQTEAVELLRELPVFLESG